MDLFRAIFESSDVEDAAEDEVASLLSTAFKPADESILPPPDPLRDLFEVDRRARALEKKTFATKPEEPVALGPERPPPEVLAAMAEAMKSKVDQESDSEEDVRLRKKRKREKSDRSEKVSDLSKLNLSKSCLLLMTGAFQKHKKKSKKHKKDKRIDSNGSSSSEDERKKRKLSADGAMKFRPKTTVAKAETEPALARSSSNVVKPSFADNESSPDVEEEVLMKMVKKAAATKRLTAADFM